MIINVGHVGVAVRNLRDSTRLFERLLGKKPDHEETVGDQRVTAVMFRIGNSAVELIEPTDPDSSVSRFIDRRGEAVHHISLEVDDIESELSRIRQAGFQLIDERPRRGSQDTLVAFIHPKSTNGILVELVQRRR
ncbi:MAG TPA: methylmalonyl-CoA epimerase [Bacteroidota bacterium]|nr:methylmalonyl-CoA epimerase [Bacteroidota bacterium]